MQQLRHDLLQQGAQLFRGQPDERSPGADQHGLAAAAADHTGVDPRVLIEQEHRGHRRAAAHGQFADQFQKTALQRIDRARSQQARAHRPGHAGGTLREDAAGPGQAAQRHRHDQQRHHEPQHRRCRRIDARLPGKQRQTGRAQRHQRGHRSHRHGRKQRQRAVTPRRLDPTCRELQDPIQRMPIQAFWKGGANGSKGAGRTACAGLPMDGGRRLLPVNTGEARQERCRPCPAPARLTSRRTPPSGHAPRWSRQCARAPP